jgi:hypothetical protein
MLSAADLQGLEHVNICTGGDHGAGRFRMLLKVLLRYSADKPSIVRQFEIANVSHSNDDIGILNKTVLQRIIAGLRTINSSGTFMVRLKDNNRLELSFNSTSDNENILCTVPIHLVINGNLKYFAQMLRREGMSSNWRM